MLKNPDKNVLSGFCKKNLSKGFINPDKKNYLENPDKIFLSGF